VAFFLVERYVPSMSGDDLAEAVAPLGQVAMRARHVWSTLVASEETCLSLFEAADRETVERANAEAAFPFDRVVEALVLGDPRPVKTL
jgi:hypothetical protein